MSISSEDQREEDCQTLKGMVAAYIPEESNVKTLKVLSHECSGPAKRTVYTLAAVDVHGHLQCAQCGRVLESCCD